MCGGCGSAAPLAEAVVELDEIAAIVRCRGCTHTLVTVLRDGDGVRVVIGALRELARGEPRGQPSRSVIAIRTGTQPIVVRKMVSREMTSPTSKRCE